ncbi:hypothetical protein B0A50_04524 [Salinomyces thailandicus]|uniref:Dihydrofolate synthetase n=1 Tax=Salinomyces thailandicus TaxID=706561 RepID=A0A4U0TXR9_9PEZI|nr:hypothetical protein B0A50_04524 [Salinomyces thailandica]
MIELGLQRIARLLEKTPLPWRAIHVAGTNGKGSICAYASAMLEAYNRSKYRSHTRQPVVTHGRFTSPHLIDRWDCITVNQEPVPWKLFDHIEQQVKRRNELDEINASEFELLTATAFEIFTHENLDIGVVEVGMGGRLDATNIVGKRSDIHLPENSRPEQFRAAPLVTSIAKIGLDHQGFLGTTIEEIATEKAGIIKHGVPVVWDGSNEPSVLRVLERAAKDNPVCAFDDTQLPQAIVDALSVPTQLPQHDGGENGNSLPEHTRQNLNVAFRSTWAALRQLGRLPTQSDSSVAPDQSVLDSLSAAMIDASTYVNFPGRQQSISIASLTGRSTSIMLDGAHNGQSAQALAHRVGSTSRGSDRDPPRSVTWIVAASDTKDAREILEPLLRANDHVFAVEFGPVEGMPWVKAMPAEKIVATIRQLAQERAESFTSEACGVDLLRAFRSATLRAGEDGCLAVAGSLYLVGDTLRLLRDHAKSSLRD